MKETKCEAVRRELEDLMLGDECSIGATQHLRDCGDCREFHEKQNKLRQIVGSLGTVEAPADFDFRLRARLANESGSTGFHLRSVQWSFANKGFAVAAMLLLFVAGMVYVRSIIDKPSQKTTAEQRNEPGQPTPKPTEEKVVVHDSTPVLAFDNGPRKAKSERRVSQRTKPSLAALDFGVERPTVISNSQRQSPIFPIDASLQSLRFSFDDGRGNARTISVPTITFGSQRVLPSANQFVSTKTDW
jgi:hypothetical protein